MGKAYGVILLLAGPPGVGKTSIVKSIAKALNREFVKISLAGMSDADPLKGYDRNYKQAKPGEIVNAIIKAKIIKITPALGNKKHTVVAQAKLEVVCPDGNE